jgi:NAD(P)-dependent dehydrogenase (short-subunit alcohol dehydrogenase family)
MGRLDGRVAFVTGAAAGIGRAAAIALAREGAGVFITDIDMPGLRETAAIITAAGGTAQARGQDVVEEARWAELMTRTMALFGRLDILVNNAGIAIGGPLLDMSLEQWNRQLAINMTGVFLGIKHAIPAMRADKPAGAYRGGSIINISSVAGLAGAPGLAGYCATKGGVRPSPWSAPKPATAFAAIRSTRVSSTPRSGARSMPAARSTISCRKARMRPMPK